ncbi:ankyrin [Anaeromyces robustus]|uniref:Ankyrin n=1 Tax=Anaeromyces robustus TaxID=1754192 RepID=A0A1Y1XQR2_9FUNG|nr:ankyrin [Anaeromyces robustus]|eukprot:ORX87654.1 ankyrin [Anaeromyces robustus]
MDKEESHFKKSISNKSMYYAHASPLSDTNIRKINSLPQFQEDETSSVSTYSSIYNAASSGIYTPRKLVGVSKLSESIISLSDFKYSDTHPQQQRSILCQLQKHTNKLIQENKLKPLPKDAQKGKKEFSIKPKSRTMNRINAFLSKKKSRKSKDEHLHLLKLAVHDRRIQQACTIIEELSSNTFRKRNFDEANNIFVRAMLNNLEPVVLSMLDKGFPPNINLPIFEVQMANDVKVKLPSYFLLAVALGLDNVIKVMIKKAYINQSWNGLTALHIACCKGDDKLINLIIDYGADLNQPIPIEQYLNLGRLKSVEARIFTHKTGVLNGTYIDDQLGSNNYSSQNTSVIRTYPKAPYIYPIDFAASTGNVKIAGIIINKVGINGIRRSRYCLMMQQQYNMSMILLKYGASFPQVNIWNDTPLHIASRQGNLRLVIVYSYLINVNTPGQNGWYPLHEAIVRNYRDVCQYLLKRGAQVELTNSEGYTPRELAMKWGISQEDIESCLDQTVEFVVENEISEKEILAKLNRYLSNLAIMNSSRIRQTKKKSQLLLPKVFQKEQPVHK